MSADDQLIKIRTGFHCSHAIGSDYEEIVYGPLRSEWNAMTEQERDAWLGEFAETTRDTMIETFAEVVE